MNNEVRKKLVNLVATYGSDEISTNIRKTEGLLRDFCGEHKREIAVLISAMKHRIPEEILSAKSNTINQLQFSRFAKRLHDNEGTSEEYAKWAVESWAVALGKEVETNHAAKPETEEIEDKVDTDSGSSNTYPKEEISRPSVGSYTDPLIGMEFVYVNGGCYEMGDTFGDGDGGEAEQPVHEVSIDDFYIGKYVVTQGQWEDVMGNNPSRFKKGHNYPVEQVSWDNAQEFIVKLNKKAEKNYRLPTEAEWEYAARSGGKREKYAGTSSESELDRYCWYDENSSSITHPVGQKKPNGLGIYDMSGNVFEWCSDWDDENYYSESPHNNPKGSKSGYFRVVRGGSWFYGARHCRSSNRYYYGPSYGSYYLGFRLVLPQAIK